MPHGVPRRGQASPDGATVHREAIPTEAVDRLLHNAVGAASAGFTQGWKLLVLEEAEDRERFWSVLRRDLPADEEVAEAPLLIRPARDALTERGVDIEDVTDLGGILSAGFADPDGNTWTLQAMPEASEG